MKKKKEKPKRRGVPFWEGRRVFRQASDRRERRRDDEQHSSGYGQGTIPRPLRSRYLESCAGVRWTIDLLRRYRTDPIMRSGSKPIRENQAGAAGFDFAFSFCGCPILAGWAWVVINRQHQPRASRDPANPVSPAPSAPCPLRIPA